jgi:hypothetical protein
MPEHIPGEGLREVYVPSLPEHHENVEAQYVVPLVYYVGSNKYTVGRAVVKEDGSFTGMIDQIYQMKVKQHLEERKMSFVTLSFDPPIPEL